MRTRIGGWIPLINQPRDAQTVPRWRRPTYDGGLRPSEVTHGLGESEVKVLVDHPSASAQPEGHHVANGDGRQV